MSAVLLGQAYSLRLDPKLRDAMQPYPPLGTLYVASYLRQRGRDVALFDAMLAESDREWDDALDRSDPAVVVLYEDNFNYLSKMCLSGARDAAFRMIARARQAGRAVVVAGSDATDNPDLYLQRGAHFVIRGEGEQTLAELLNHLLGASSTPDAIPSFDAAPGTPHSARPTIPGLAYLEDGATRLTPPRPDLRDLDALPFPAWDLVDVERYRAIWLRRHGYFSMNVATSRGCPFHCNWCAKPIWGQRYAARSPENVVAELAWLRRAYRPDHIWFVDDIFGLKPGWVEHFADLLERDGPPLPFKCLQRVDLLLKGDTIPALRRAGARTVWVGAESGSQAILDAMDKGTRVEQIREASRLLRDAGVEVGFFLQFGYSGETRADVEATLRLARDCRPDDIGVSVSYPLPGTRFYEAVRQELGDKRHWVDSDDLAMLYRGPHTTAFYRQLHTVVHREHRGRRLAATLAPALRRPWRLRPTHAHQAARLLAHRLLLPLDRRRLASLARQPHQPLALTPPSIGHAAAATPSPQPDSSAAPHHAIIPRSGLG